MFSTRKSKKKQSFSKGGSFQSFRNSSPIGSSDSRKNFQVPPSLNDFKKKTGGEGEDLAESFLKAEGFEILDRNFRCKGGEIDLVAAKKGEIHFVEVKTRNSLTYGDPFESITNTKQRRISQAAQIYLLKNPYFEKHQKNFSVMAINLANSPTKVEFIPNAFELIGHDYY